MEELQSGNYSLYFVQYTQAKKCTLKNFFLHPQAGNNFSI